MEPRVNKKEKNGYRVGGTKTQAKKKISMTARVIVAPNDRGGRQAKKYEQAYASY